MNEDKVFCKNCRYFRRFSSPGHPFVVTDCYAPENTEETYDFEGKYEILINDPNFINKNNNCPWFKKKWYKRIFK